MKRPDVNVLDLGSVPYKKAWDLQEKMLKENVDEKIQAKKENRPAKTYSTLIFCEHPHVYTLGKSGEINNLLLTEAELQSKKIDYFHINRGGDITYHGPGQVVVYPILDLELFFTDIHKYMRYLEEAVILTIADYGIRGERIDGLTGVWVDAQHADKARKISAFGVKTSRWVTMHGIGFNVNTDLSFFDYIVPCGISDKGVTSMEKELCKPVDIREVKSRLLYHIAGLFNMNITTTHEP